MFLPEVELFVKDSLIAPYGQGNMGAGPWEQMIMEIIAKVRYSYSCLLSSNCKY